MLKDNISKLIQNHGFMPTLKTFEAIILAETAEVQAIRKSYAKELSRDEQDDLDVQLYTLGDILRHLRTAFGELGISGEYRYSALQSQLEPIIDDYGSIDTFGVLKQLADEESLLLREEWMYERQDLSQDEQADLLSQISEVKVLAKHMAKALRDIGENPPRQDLVRILKNLIQKLSPKQFLALIKDVLLNFTKKNPPRGYTLREQFEEEYEEEEDVQSFKEIYIAFLHKYGPIGATFAIYSALRVATKKAGKGRGAVRLLEFFIGAIFGRKTLKEMKKVAPGKEQTFLDKLLGRK